MANAWICLVAVALISGANAVSFNFPWGLFYYNTCIMSKAEGYDCHTGTTCPPATLPSDGPVCTLPTQTCCKGPTCGVAFPDQGLTSRLSNSVVDQVGNNPWLVRMRGSTGIQWCGGVLVSPSYVLVDAICAALCVSASNEIICSATVGDFSNTQVDPNQAERAIAEFIYHPAAAFQSRDEFYNLTDLEDAMVNNFALARLSAPVTVGVQGVNIPCSPTSGTVFSNCRVAGFGTTDPLTGVQNPSIRRVLEVDRISNDACESIRNKPTPTNAACATLRTAGSGICFGDNGGPLVCQNDFDGSWSLQGILTFLPDPVNEYCSKETFVYADINTAWDWVFGIINRS